MILAVDRKNTDAVTGNINCKNLSAVAYSNTCLCNPKHTFMSNDNGQDKCTDLTDTQCGATIGERTGKVYLINADSAKLPVYICCSI